MKSKEFALESKRSKIKMPKQRDPNWQTMRAKATSGAAGEHKDNKRADKQGDVKHKKDLVPMEDIFKESEDSSVDEVVAFAPGYGSSSIKNTNAPRRKTSSMLAIMQAINKKEQEKQKIKDSDKVKRMGEDNTQELYGLRIGDTVTTELNGQLVQGDVIDIFPEDMEVELFLRGPETGRTIVVDVRDTEIVEATGDEKFDTMMRTIKKGTKKQATADRRDREAESRRRARDAFGPSPADKLSIRSDKDVEEGLTTEKQILTRIRQIMHDRKLSGTESNAGELHRLKQQLKDMRSQQSVAEGDEPDEQYLDKVISDLHKDAFGMRPDREFGREWMSSSYKEKLRIYNNMLKNLHSDLDEASDWGEPRDILEDVLQTLEREVEWPLSEVMEPREFRPLLSALVRAVNDKLLSMDRDGNQ